MNYIMFVLDKDQNKNNNGISIVDHTNLNQLVPQSERVLIFFINYMAVGRVVTYIWTFSTEVAGAVEITTYSTDEADYVDDGQTGSSLDLHDANETGTDAIGYINGDHTNDIDDDLTNDIDNDIDNDISGKAVIQIL